MCLCGRTCSIFEGGWGRPWPAQHETSGFQGNVSDMDNITFGSICVRVILVVAIV